MSFDRIAISSGHGRHIRGADGILEEVTEARRIVERVAEELRNRGIAVETFHDNTSYSQNENLDTIVAWHNGQKRDVDISVHLNAYVETSNPMGVEVLYVTQAALAGKVSAAVADAGGLIDRGAKKRTDLAFLNGTEQPAILIETCFVDSVADAGLYQAKFDSICEAIADVLEDDEDAARPPDEAVLFAATGKVSWFGGPQDDGVAPDEGLAFIYDVSDAPHLFLPVQPPGTTGLARRLNPDVHYVACRWDYEVTPKPSLLEARAMVRATGTGRELLAWPADWGPNSETGRVADISPGLMADLGIETDAEVEIVYPWPKREVR